MTSLVIKTVSGSPGLKSVVLSPTTAVGGVLTSGNRVYLDGTATLDTAVTLTSSDTSVATVPSTVTVLDGYSSRKFDIKTKPVTSTKTITITAKFGSVTQTATLTVSPKNQ